MIKNTKKFHWVSGATTSRLHAQGHRTGHWTGGGCLKSAAAQRSAPPSPEAVRKTLHKAETIEPAGMEVATGYGEGTAGDLFGYVPTG